MRAFLLAAIAAAALGGAPAQAKGCRCDHPRPKPSKHDAAPEVRVFRGVSLEEPAPASAREGRSYVRVMSEALPVDIGWSAGIIDDDGYAFLDPWLSDTREGRYFVTWNFDRDRNGILRRREAVRANAAFADLADTNGDGRLSEAEIDDALARIGL